MLLDACPLCRTVLPPPGEAGAPVCPGCGADLAPYLQLETRAEQYVGLCLDLLARGQVAEAAKLLDVLPTITSLNPQTLAELQARLALQTGRLVEAEQHLAHCAPATAAVLGQQIASAADAQRTGMELYNYALTSARAGQLQLAASTLARAVTYAAHEPQIWQLKLDVDLSCHDYSSCYADLRKLDELSARPRKYLALEQLLPSSS